MTCPDKINLLQRYSGKKNTKKIQNMKSKDMNGNIKHLSLFCPENIITISKLAMLYSFSVLLFLSVFGTHVHIRSS